MVMDMYDYDGD